MKNFEKHIDDIAMSLYELNIFLKSRCMLSAGCLIFNGDQNDPGKIKEWLLEDCEEEKKKFKLSPFEYDMLVCVANFYYAGVGFYRSDILMTLKDYGWFTCFSDVDIKHDLAYLVANSEVIK